MPRGEDRLQAGPRFEWAQPGIDTASTDALNPGEADAALTVDIPGRLHPLVPRGEPPFARHGGDDHRHPRTWVRRFREAAYTVLGFSITFEATGGGLTFSPESDH